MKHGKCQENGCLPTEETVQSNLVSYRYCPRTSQSCCVARNSVGTPSATSDSQWSACSVTCGIGYQTRRRPCTFSTPGCPSTGYTTESIQCQRTPCTGQPFPAPNPISSEWSACSVSCGYGFQTRTRSCNTRDPGCPLSGYITDRIQCQRPSCTTTSSGRWTAWSNWGICSVTCGRGTRTRSRSCLDGFNRCTGNSVEYQTCELAACSNIFPPNTNPFPPNTNPLPPNTNPFPPNTNPFPPNTNPFPPPSSSEWSLCSVSCGYGFQTRSRPCSFTTPGCPSSGFITETRTCGQPFCQSFAQWGPWSSWSPCSATCGYGTQRRQRECLEPSGRCYGQREALQSCNLGPCPMLSPWSEWGPCSVSCGQGYRSRRRVCRELNGTESYRCAEAWNNQEYENCFVQACPDPQCGLRQRDNNIIFDYNRLQGRILNGVDVDRCEWPWMVRVTFKPTDSTTVLNVNGLPTNEIPACGGVLVDQNSILTSATCVEIISSVENAGEFSYYVSLSDTELDTSEPGELQVEIEKTETHPEYTGSIGDRFAVKNVGILQLKEDVPITECRRTACLPDSFRRFDENMPCVIAGWGGTVDPSIDTIGFSRTLKQANVTLMNHKECQVAIEYTSSIPAQYELGEDFICVNSRRDNTAACLLDNGGMLLCKDTGNQWTVRGVLTDSECDANAPDVHANVTSSLDWIRKTMAENDRSVIFPPPPFPYFGAPGQQVPVGQFAYPVQPGNPNFATFPNQP